MLPTIVSLRSAMNFIPFDLFSIEPHKRMKYGGAVTKTVLISFFMIISAHRRTAKGTQNIWRSGIVSILKNALKILMTPFDRQL